MSVGPVLPGDERFESGIGELRGGVVGVDQSSPDPEFFDVANESAAFVVELGTLLQDGRACWGDVIEVMSAAVTSRSTAGRSWQALRRSRQLPSLRVRSLTSVSALRRSR